MSNINQNRWDQLVRRVAGLIGPGSKVNNTIGDLFPMLDVENLPAELYLLGGTRLGSGSAQQTGSAGEVPRCQIFNPADSGMIVTLTSFLVSLTVIGQIRMVNTITAESTNVVARVRDLRLGTIQPTTTEVRAASEAAVLAANGGEFRVLGTTVNPITDPNGIVVLAPGTGMTLTTSAVASTMTATFFFRERVAESSELLF